MLSSFRDHIRSEIWFVAVRSRGPGGQNVNKVSSAAVLFWDVGTSKLLLGPQKEILVRKLVNHFNRDGFIQIRSDEFRDLERNKNRCIEKLVEIIEKALHKPRKRIATKPTKASKLRKQQSKRRRSEVKSLRRKVD